MRVDAPAAGRTDDHEATAAPAASTAAGCAVNEHLWRFAAALLLPVAVLVWRHSRIVAIATAWPLAANVWVMRASIELAVEHPARVLVPAISAMLGFAELYAEGREGRRFSRRGVLGALVFASGVADIGALPTFALVHEWTVPVVQTTVLFAMAATAAWPKERKLCFSH